jgi:hypothetical protein
MLEPVPSRFSPFMALGSLPSLDIYRYHVVVDARLPGTDTVQPLAKALLL